jgi:hypothetical protein
MMQASRGSPPLALMPASNGATSWQSVSRQPIHCAWDSLSERFHRALCADSKPMRVSIDLPAASTTAVNSFSERSAAARRQSASSRAPIFLLSHWICEGRGSCANAIGAAARPIARESSNLRMSGIQTGGFTMT